MTPEEARKINQESLGKGNKENEEKIRAALLEKLATAQDQLALLIARKPIDAEGKMILPERPQDQAAVKRELAEAEQAVERIKQQLAEPDISKIFYGNEVAV